MSDSPTDPVGAPSLEFCIQEIIEKSEMMMQGQGPYIQHILKTAKHAKRHLDASHRASPTYGEPVSGDGLPLGEWWMFYDHQTGKWCVYDDGPPRVIRTDAEVFHVREVPASPVKQPVGEVTEEMVERALDVWFAAGFFYRHGSETANDPHTLKYRKKLRDNMRSALTAALASNPPEPTVEADKQKVRVKPLEWIANFASTPFGSYTVWDSLPDMWKWTRSGRIDGDESEDVFGSAKAARLSAQADYETRIRSALSPTAGERG